MEEAKAEEEIHVDEVKAITMVDGTMILDLINGVEFVKRIVMKRRIVGTEASQNTAIARGSSMCKKIVVSIINKKLHLLKKKRKLGIYSLLVAR